MAQTVNVLDQRSVDGNVVHVVFVVAKINGRFHVGQQADDLCPPAAVLLADGPAGLVQGLLQLRRGVGRNDVRHRFDLQQIQFARFERATSEFTPFGHSRRGQGGQRIHHALHHRTTTVHVQLGDGFPGVGMGRRKPGYHAGVEFLLVDGVVQCSQRKLSRYGQVQV